MHPRAALALSLLLVVAGCSALGSPTPSAAPAPSPTVDTPTRTTTPTGTPPPATPSPYPPGFGAEGVTNASRALDAHVTGLGAAGSFTLTSDATVAAPDGTTDVSFLERADLGASRAFVRTTVSGAGSRARWYANGTVYARDAPADGESTYSTANASVTPGAFTGAETVAAVLADAEWELDSETSVGGERAFVYTASNLTRTDRLLAPGIDSENVTAFEGSFVVTESGVVRELRYRATIEAGDGETRYAVDLTVSRLDETAVNSPEWVEREFDV